MILTGRRAYAAALLAIALSHTVTAQPPQLDPAVRLWHDDDLILADNVDSLTERTQHLDVPERYQLYAAWVLPSEYHGSIRLSGRFQSTDTGVLARTPTPPSADPPISFGIGNARLPTADQLSSPVFELLQAARELDRLAELLMRVDSLSAAAADSQQRAWTALRAMILLEQGRKDEAAAEIQALFRLVSGTVPVDMSEQWPETLTVWHVVAIHGDHLLAADLLNWLVTQRAIRDIPSGNRVWHQHMVSLAGWQQLWSANGKQRQFPSADAWPHAAQWLSVSSRRAFTEGSGYPPAYWNQSGDMIENISAHQDAYLLFQTPLTGDYEIECDLRSPSISRSQILAGSEFVGPRSDRKHLEIGTFRRGGRFAPLDLQLQSFDQWVRCRCEVRGGICRTWMNGRLVHTRSLTGAEDPWVGIRSWSRSHGAVRNLQIRGNPVIPSTVEISASSELSGWTPWFDESVGSATSRWQQTIDSAGRSEIVGQHDARLFGTEHESLLVYQRPLQNHGSIDYEFYYVPNEWEVHPALNRRVYLITPDGIGIHQVTCGPYDRTELPPDNRDSPNVIPINGPAAEGSAAVVSDPSRGVQPPLPVPLIAHEWNRLQIQRTDSELHILLNGQKIHQEQQPAESPSAFGLFYYSSRTSARVRNVRLRGPWPNSLVPISQQELASREVLQLDEEAGRLKTDFRHDFGSQGLPSRYFATASSAQPAAFDLNSTGLRVTRPTFDNWLTGDVRVPFTLHGDFDVEAAYDALAVHGDRDGCVLLAVHLDDEQQHECRLMRMQNSADRHLVQVSMSAMHREGGRSYSSSGQTTCEAEHGRLRIARRGEQIHFLMAENDSPMFRLIRTESVSAGPSRSDGVWLRTLGNGHGEIQVTWRSLRIRAERLTYVPPENMPQRSLYVLDTDQQQVRFVTSPGPGFTHLGSAEWAADGKTLICDMSQGGVASSHIIRLEADGSGHADLGPGCMPSYSPDQKQIVLSQSGAGVLRMQADGSGREILDRSGWGIQWSPAGRHLAWGNGNQITVLDLETQQKRGLLTEEQANELSGIYWNFGFSPDGQWIAFKARRANSSGDVVAVARLNDSRQFRIVYAGPQRVNEDLTWHPDGEHLVFSMRLAPKNRQQLVQVHREVPELPQPLSGQPADWDILDCDWSPNGRQIVFAAIVPPQPVDWSPDR